jgi:hypothetical protein
MSKLENRGHKLEICLVFYAFFKYEFYTCEAYRAIEQKCQVGFNPNQEKKKVIVLPMHE